MKKILVPTDFSKPAQKALSYAVNIALKANAEIKLLHVASNDSFLDGIAGDLEDLVNLQTIEKDKQFRKTIDTLANVYEGTNWKDIPIECQQAKGEIVKEIVAACEKQTIDLLITAAKGESNWEKVIFGSVTKRIIKKVSCPTLILPNQTTYKNIRKIAFATDLSLIGLKAIIQTHNFAQIFDAHFNFVHIKLEEKRSYQTKLNNFRLMANEAIGHENYEIVEIEADGIIEGLNRYASENPIDILAMLRHRHSMLNKLFTISYVEEMTRSAIPILIFSE